MNNSNRNTPQAGTPARTLLIDSCPIGPGRHSMSWLEAVGTDVTLLRK